VLFAVGIEHALDVPVRCPHDADARKHCRPIRFRDQDQSFHRNSLAALGSLSQIGFDRMREEKNLRSGS
jgi:hypothetical protein